MVDTNPYFVFIISILPNRHLEGYINFIGLVGPLIWNSMWVIHMSESMFGKLIDRIRSPFFHLNDLLHDWEFIQSTCEQHGIGQVNGNIQDLFESCRKQADELGLSEDQVFCVIVNGLHSLNEKKELKKLINAVTNKVQEMAQKFGKPTHAATVYQIALGIIATYYLRALLEVDYLALE